MGRYSAPQFDHDNEDDGQEMDWTTIPEDGDTGDLNNSFADVGLGDSRSLVRSNISSNGDGYQDHDSENDSHISRGGKGGHLAGQSRSNSSTHNENHLQDATNAEAYNYNNTSESLLRVAEQYLEHSNLYLEQHRLDQKKRHRIKTITIAAVGIIAIVLKRHAPPPPPIWSQSMSFAASFSTDLDETSRARSDPSITDSTSGITQHETWASYSRHLLHLVYHAVAYGVSVAWYAISNAFCYAIEEVKDASLLFLHGNGNNDDGSMWMNWKKKMVLTGTDLSQLLQTAKESQHNSQPLTDTHDDANRLQKMRSPCPIRLPAANNLHTHLPRGAATHGITDDGSIMEGWSTEEFLRQTVGTSLSPQNLALKVISEGIDRWGETLVEEAPVALVHKIATATSTGPKHMYIDNETLSGWILPPAAGFLLVGPEGVGKLHTARCISHLFLGHCSDASILPGSKLGGTLEVIAGEYNQNGHEVHPAKELIVKHIQSRRGLGSVIIIHHIELLPTSFLSDISEILGGKTDTLSYGKPEKLEEASCDGTVFVLTSKQWGTKSIFQHIQRNDGLHGLRRDPLVSSIRWEVDSHLDYWTKLAAHTTVAPLFPFDIEDLSSILQNRVQTLNQKYQRLHWKQLDVSHAMIKHAVGIDHVDYLDIYKQDGGSGEEQLNAALLTFSTSGAHALDNNALWQALRTRLVSGTRRRPGLTLKVDLGDANKEAVFRWCSHENSGVISCEEERRSLLN